MKQGLDLVALATEIQRQSTAKKDIVASTENMSVAVVDAKPTLRIGNGEEYKFGMNGTAHKQVARELGIPTQYYDRMLEKAPDLWEANVNGWMHKEPTARLVRTLDDNARAFLSNSYRPLENSDLAEAVLPVISEMGLMVVSSQITETRFNLKVVDARIERDVPTGRRIGDGSHVFFDTCSPAALISNSEVGMGALNLEAGMLTKMCTNLAWTMKAVRKTHLGARHELASDSLYSLLSTQTRRLTDAALWSQVRDVLRSLFEEKQFEAMLAKIGGTAEDKIEGDPIKVVDLSAKKFGLSEGEKTSVLKHLIQGGDLSRYGLFNAVTRTAEDLPDYDRASDFEKLGGKIIELPRNEWKVLAEAA
jgi:hypothetical protein